MTTAREDLAWLFGACESEMGVKSNFASFIAASKVGLNRSRVDADSGEIVNGAQEDLALAGEDAMIDALDRKRAASRIGAASRNRRVMQAYQRVDVRFQRILELAYEPRQRPHKVTAELGEAAGVAPLTPTARGLAAWSWKWFAGALARRERKAVAIKSEAQALFAAALAAYDRAREPDQVEGAELAAGATIDVVELRELLGMQARETRVLVRRLRALAEVRPAFPFFRLRRRWTTTRAAVLELLRDLGADDNPKLGAVAARVEAL